MGVERLKQLLLDGPLRRVKMNESARGKSGLGEKENDKAACSIVFDRSEGYHENDRGGTSSQCLDPLGYGSTTPELSDQVEVEGQAKPEAQEKLKMAWASSL